MIEFCFFCRAEVVLCERVAGDLSQWRGAHRVCYRHVERKEAAKPVPIIYQYYQIVPGALCRQCERLPEEFVVLHTSVTAVFVGRHEEHLCTICFGKRRKLLDNAQWIQVSKIVEGEMKS